MTPPAVPQVWKQRGEEYRIHGQTGWLWLSSTRRYRPAAASERGLAAGPHRVRVTLAPAAAPGGEAAAKPALPRGLWVPYAAYRRLLERQAEAGGPSDRLVSVRLKPGSCELQTEPDGPAEEASVAAPPPPPPQPQDVVDVSACLAELRRTHLPRQARPGRLDRLLVWREELERRERGEESSSDTDDAEEAETGVAAARRELTAAERRLELLTVYPCYSRGCRSGAPCYSPSCREAVSGRWWTAELAAAGDGGVRVVVSADKD